MIQVFRFFWLYSAASPGAFFAGHPSNLTFRDLRFHRRDRSRYQRRQASRRYSRPKSKGFLAFIGPSPPARYEFHTEHFILQDVTWQQERKTTKQKSTTLTNQTN